MNRYNELPHQPYPIRERVGQGIFTDREQEMAMLMGWAESVSRERQKSIALVSPRRYGKTAILERFYNRIFWERDDVIPFYYELGKPPVHVLKFVKEYYISFLRQFTAYQIRDAGLAFDASVKEDELYRLAEGLKDDNLKRSIDIIPTLLQEGHEELFSVALTAPKRFAVRAEKSIIVMFDEFQRLNQVLYLDEAHTIKCSPYSDAFSSVVESAAAPMLIAGSQMSILTRQALSGGMTGRVKRIKLGRLSLQASAELAIKLAHEESIDLPLELAYSIARMTWRHPYYIWCIFNTNLIDDGLHTKQDIRDRLKFEIESDEGQINEFWREHFIDNMEMLDEPEAKKMIFYLMNHPKKEARVDEIVDKLGLAMSKETANRQLRKLVLSDLIKQVRLGGIYGGVSDPMLRRVLRLEYSWELEDLSASDVSEKIDLELAQELIAEQEQLIASLRGELNLWVGRIAEVFIEKLMKRCFEGQTLSGERYFNVGHEVKLSRFKRVYTTFAQPMGAPRAYQIDLYGEPEAENDLPWVVESKNWQRPVDRPTVEHFLRAAENLADEKGYGEVCRWFYARSGFTQPAEELLQAQGVLYSEQGQLVELLQELDVIEEWQV